MRPRPRSRRKPVEYVPPEELVAEIRQLRKDIGEPPAMLVGQREWNLIRRQPTCGPFLSGVSDQELALDGVPVIVRPHWSRPQVMATWAEYEEAMLKRP